MVRTHWRFCILLYMVLLCVLVIWYTYNDNLDSKFKYACTSKINQLNFDQWNINFWKHYNNNNKESNRNNIISTSSKTGVMKFKVLLLLFRCDWKPCGPKEEVILWCTQLPVVTSVQITIIKSYLLRMEWMFQHWDLHDLKTFGLKINKMSNETNKKWGENLKTKTYHFEG